MTTPTREQVIAAFIAEFEPMGYEMDLAKCLCCTFASDSTQHAFMGYTAGRDQGLREAAAKVRAILADCEARDVDDPELEQVAQDIEQLRSD